MIPNEIAKIAASSCARSNNNPLVSCILPVYNSEKYLHESINSILRQTYDNFELIIVNDGSTDGSAAIIEQQRDPRIRRIYQENSGIVSALNAGLALTDGEFIARMDADDISLPDRFEKQVGFLLNNPGVALVGGCFVSINSQGNIDESKSCRQLPKHGKRTVTDFDTFPPKVATALHPLIMMRADAIRAIGGYRHGFKHAEDYDMYIRISQYGRLENIDDIILKYRQHGNNISAVHTFEQEKSAARAEIDNFNSSLNGRRTRSYKISDRTLDGYVQLRTFRREIGMNMFNYPRAIKALKLIILGSPSSTVGASMRLLAVWLYNNGRYLAKIVQRQRGLLRGG